MGCLATFGVEFVTKCTKRLHSIIGDAKFVFKLSHFGPKNMRWILFLERVFFFLAIRRLGICLEKVAPRKCQDCYPREFEGATQDDA